MLLQLASSVLVVKDIFVQGRRRPMDDGLRGRAKLSEQERVGIEEYKWRSRVALGLHESEVYGLSEER